MRPAGRKVAIRMVWMAAAISLVGIGAFLCLWLGYEGFVNHDAAHVVAGMAWMRLKEGKPIDPSSLDAEIRLLIEGSVIHGTLRGGKAFNVWGKPFQVTPLPSWGVLCRSPGLWGSIGSAEFQVDD